MFDGIGSLVAMCGAFERMQGYLIEYRALLRQFTALSIECRAVLGQYRALSMNIGLFCDNIRLF